MSDSHVSSAEFLSAQEELAVPAAQRETTVSHRGLPLRCKPAMSATKMITHHISTGCADTSSNVQI